MTWIEELEPHLSDTQLTCPYCHESDEMAGWELDDDWGETECSNCGRTFLYDREIQQYLYRTQKKEDSCG